MIISIRMGSVIYVFNNSFNVQSENSVKKPIVPHVRHSGDQLCDADAGVLLLLAAPGLDSQPSHGSSH